MFNQFTEYVANASGWAYAVVFLLALLDAILPVVPSETAVITAGVVAGSGRLSLPLIVASATAGAMAGDNTAYLVGRASAAPPPGASSTARRRASGFPGRSASSASVAAS